MHGNRLEPPAGILVCGLNGSGKSTLGRALAEALGFHFIDSEDLFFPKAVPAYLYASPRSRREAEALFRQEAAAHPQFVFAAVKGDYGDAAAKLYRRAVWVQAPRELRLQRVRERSFQKFGSRMLPGGDLYEQEQAFFAMVSARTEQEMEQWVRTLPCLVLRVDGTRPVLENIRRIRTFYAESFSV